MKGLLAVTLASLLIAGSSEPRHRTVMVAPSGEVVVPDAPPQLKQEPPGPAPNTAWVWQPGYWSYGNGRWVRVLGLAPRVLGVKAWKPNALRARGH